MSHDDLNEIGRIVRQVVEMLVDDPAQVQVRQAIEGHRHVIVTVQVPKSERRFIVGGGGRTIDAIERIVKVIAGKHRHSAEVDFYNPSDQTVVYHRRRRRR